MRSIARDGRLSTVCRSEDLRQRNCMQAPGTEVVGSTNLYDLAGRDIGGRRELLQQRQQGPTLLGLLHRMLAAEEKARKTRSLEIL